MLLPLLFIWIRVSFFRHRQSLAHVFAMRSMLNLKEDTYHKYTSRSGRFVEMIAYFLSCITQHNQIASQRALSLCSQNRYYLKMVKVGDFSLQLVDATTKEPFKEHVAPTDGQSYAGKIIYLLHVLYV